MNSFIVFGLQRSGTTFLEELVKLNIKHSSILNHQNSWIWKHAYDVDLDGILVHEKLKETKANCLYIIKHPFTWIQSVCKKKADTLDKYPNIKARASDSQVHVYKNFNLLRMAQLYNKHARYWRCIINSVEYTVLFIKYEDLINTDEDTIEMIRDIAEFFNTEINERIKIPRLVNQSKKFTEKRRMIYKNVLLDKRIFNPIRLHAITQMLDKSLIKDLRYNINIKL